MKNKQQKELVGVKEIARRANVSIATVDRVLNNRTGVAAKTKEAIQKIIKELDYQPNIMARRLASRKVLKFAVLIPSVSGETRYWDFPLRGVQQAGVEIKDYGIVVDVYFFDLNTKSTFDMESNKIIQGNYNGVVVAPSFEEESVAFVSKLTDKNVPVVFINSDMDEQHSLCYIGPDLYQSGFLGAHLAKYLVKDHQTVLIVNISKVIGSHHHLLKKEEGFRDYFSEYNKSVKLNKIDIRETDYESVSVRLQEYFKENSADLIFVTNSRVFSVSRFLEESNRQQIKLMGYDFLEENIECLKKGVVDFLICQKPQEQGYRGIMALYNHLVHSIRVESKQFMPIDIITKENYKYYKN